MDKTLSSYISQFNKLMDKVPEEIRSDFLQLVQKGAISEPVFAAFGKYLEALVENSPFCVLVADSEGKLVMSNSASEKMFGTKLPKGLAVFDEFLKISKNDFVNPNTTFKNPKAKEFFFQYDSIQYFPDIIHKTIECRCIIFPVKSEYAEPTHYILMFEELTDLQQMTRLLDEQSRKYMTIFNNIQDVYFETKPDGTIIEMSPSILKYSGYKREDLIGKNVVDFYADKSVRTKILKQFVDYRQVKDFELEMVHLDGHVLTTLMTASLIKDENSGEERIVGSMIDISERKMFQKLLEENEQKYRQLFDNSPLGIAIVDKAGHILDCNQLFRSFFFTGTELASCSMISGFKGDGLQQLIDAMFSTETKQEGVLEFEDNEKTMAVQCVPFHFQNQSEQYAHVMVEDITEKSKTHRQLEEIQYRYKDIIEKTNDLIYTLDLEGNFTSVNPIAEQWLGFEFDKLPIHERNMKRFISEESYKKAVENIQEKLKGGSERSKYEITTYTKKGEKMILEINSFLRKKDGKPIEIFGIARDMTQRKAYEEQIKASLREKEFFIKEIHHRIKNNMQVILSLIRMNLAKISDQQIIFFLNDLQMKIKTISLVHEDLYLGGNLHEVDFKEYVKKILVNLFDVHRTNVNVKFVTNIKPCKMNMDVAIPCGLIINELCTNALKYAYDDTEYPEFHVHFNYDEEKAVLTVFDNGKGFDTGQIAETEESLGLNLVKILSEEQLEGEMSLITTKGCRFEVIFPFMAAGSVENS